MYRTIAQYDHNGAQTVFISGFHSSGGGGGGGGGKILYFKIQANSGSRELEKP